MTWEWINNDRLLDSLGKIKPLNREILRFTWEISWFFVLNHHNTPLTFIDSNGLIGLHFKSISTDNEMNVSSTTGWTHYFSVCRLERTSHLCKLIKENLPEIVICSELRDKAVNQLFCGAWVLWVLEIHGSNFLWECRTGERHRMEGEQLLRSTAANSMRCSDTSDINSVPKSSKLPT